MKPLLLAFYGDDFTGSTDALEFLSRAGAKTMLFIEPPTPEILAQYPTLDAIGVASVSRSLSTIEIEKVLQKDFEKLKKLPIQHIHYKNCSTFDSSPAIGSIGKAIDVGHGIFKNIFVPIVGGAPALGRYCVFGNLFANIGIGTKGQIYRLDRHPSMRQHPVTPAHESDLREHLGQQTEKKTALIDILQLEKPVTEWTVEPAAEAVLIDVLYEEQLQKIGEWLENQRLDNIPLFSVGSSAIEMALGLHWQSKQILQPRNNWCEPATVNPLLVISGSCSPITATQITWAKSHGFEEIIINAANICCTQNADLQRYINVGIAYLQQNKNVIIHTGNKQIENLSSQKLGTALGLIAKALVTQQRLKRLIISGGDTSSYAAKALEVEALEMISPWATGAPLCRVTSNNVAINGLEVNFKGGQVGSENYFGIST
jgi:3-oxoisoapionate kinase